MKKRNAKPRKQALEYAAYYPISRRSKVDSLQLIGLLCRRNDTPDPLDCYTTWRGEVAELHVYPATVYWNGRNWTFREGKQYFDGNRIKIKKFKIKKTVLLIEAAG